MADSTAKKPAIPLGGTLAYYELHSICYFVIEGSGVYRVSDESTYTRKFRKELMAGLSSLVLLAVLARARREMYGYEIAKAVKSEGEGGLIFKQGAIYPVLRSLDAQGLLASRVEASAFGPPRRYYAITDEGLQALAEWQGAWRDMREFVDDALTANGADYDHDNRPAA